MSNKIEVQAGVQLSESEVLSLLEYFDDSSDKPLHESLDFESYSVKLSRYAHFVLAYDGIIRAGFLAYYLNEEGRFVYVPQAVVHKEYRHQGIGHLMFSPLFNCSREIYKTIRLEVLKENEIARNFYAKEGFSFVESRKERILLEKNI